MSETAPAGFWIRAIAFVLDVIVMFFVQASYSAVASVLFGADPETSLAVSSTVSLFTLVFAALYTTVLHASTGQTLGKFVARIRVVALDGEPPEAGAAFLRWLAYALSFATFGFGFLMAGLRTDKRALHDMIASTRVERIPRVSRTTEREQPIDRAGGASPEEPGHPRESSAHAVATINNPAENNPAESRPPATGGSATPDRPQ
jgi:uncharacterized RDD family membrane protein YckC